MNDRSEKAGRVLQVFRNLNPTPATELEFATPWQLLVATILSAQSTDRQVNKTTSRLFRKYPGPFEFAALEPSQLASEIRELGLFRNKSRHIVAAARAVTDQYGGEVPKDPEELMKLPGVGRKTANVVASSAFGVPALGVDTHVFRVANRIGLSAGKTPLDVERQLTEVIPEGDWSKAHHWLILHGRYICTARKPHCEKCPVSEDCRFYIGDREEEV